MRGSLAPLLLVGALVIPVEVSAAEPPSDPRPPPQGEEAPPPARPSLVEGLLRALERLQLHPAGHDAVDAAPAFFRRPAPRGR